MHFFLDFLVLVGKFIGIANLSGSNGRCSGRWVVIFQGCDGFPKWWAQGYHGSFWVNGSWGGGEGYPKTWSTGGVFFRFFSPKKYFDTPIFVGKMMSNLTLAYFFPDGFWSHQENNEGHKVVSPRNVEGWFSFKRKSTRTKLFVGGSSKVFKLGSCGAWWLNVQHRVFGTLP